MSEIWYFKSVLIQYLDDMCWVAVREVRILRKQRNRGIYIKMAGMCVDFGCVCIGGGEWTAKNSKQTKKSK